MVKSDQERSIEVKIIVMGGGGKNFGTLKPECLIQGDRLI